MPETDTRGASPHALPIAPTRANGPRGHPRAILWGLRRAFTPNPNTFTFQRRKTLRDAFIRVHASGGYGHGDMAVSRRPVRRHEPATIFLTSGNHSAHTCGHGGRAVQEVSPRPCRKAGRTPRNGGLRPCVWSVCLERSEFGGCMRMPLLRRRSNVFRARRHDYGHVGATEWSDSASRPREL